MKELPCHVWVSGWLVIEVGPFTILWCAENILSKSKSSTSTTNHWPHPLENLPFTIILVGTNIPKDYALEERGPNRSMAFLSMFGFNKSCWISDVIQNASFQKMFPANWFWAPNGFSYKCSGNIRKCTMLLTSKVDNPSHMLSSSNNHTAWEYMYTWTLKRGAKLMVRGAIKQPLRA